MNEFAIPDISSLLRLHGNDALRDKFVQEYLNSMKPLSPKECTSLYYHFIDKIDGNLVLEFLRDTYNYTPINIDIFMDSRLNKRIRSYFYEISIDGGTISITPFTNFIKCWSNNLPKNIVQKYILFYLTSPIYSKTHAYLQVIKENANYEKDDIISIVIMQIKQLAIDNLKILMDVFELYWYDIPCIHIVGLIQNMILKKTFTDDEIKFIVKTFNVNIADLEEHDMFENIIDIDICYIKQVISVFELENFEIPKKYIHSLIKNIIQTKKGKHKKNMEENLIYIRDKCSVDYDDIIESKILNFIVSIRDTTTIIKMREIFSVSARDLNIVVNDPSVTCSRGDNSGFERYKKFISKYTHVPVKGALT